MIAIEKTDLSLDYAAKLRCQAHFGYGSMTSHGTISDYIEQVQQ